MPHITQRRRELNQLAKSKDNFFAEWLLLRRRIQLHELFDNLDTCSFLELKKLRFRHLNLLLTQIRKGEHAKESTRFLSRQPYRFQSDEMFERPVFTYNVPHFRQMARRDFSTFLRIVALIQNHPVFCTDKASYRKQRKVWQQALVCFERLGCNGNDASVEGFAREFGIGVGTVVFYTQHVVKALLSLEKQYVFWLEEEERSAISTRMATHRFPDCVGFIDGTYVVLRYCPTKDEKTFLNWKSRYPYNVMLVCDDKKRIRYIVCG